MAVPSNGPISIGDIVAEYGDADGAPSEFSEFYAGGDNVGGSAEGLNGPVPSSGTLALSDFLGSSDTGIGINFEVVDNFNSLARAISPGNYVSNDYTKQGMLLDDQKLVYGGSLYYDVSDSDKSYKSLMSDLTLCGYDSNLADGEVARTIATIFGITSHSTIHSEPSADSTFGRRVDRDSQGPEGKIGTWSGGHNYPYHFCISEVGKLYFYERTSDTAVTANNTITLLNIGHCLSMNASGDKLVAVRSDGIIKTYTRSVSTWSEVDGTDFNTTVLPCSRGVPVRMSGDGNWLLVGEPSNNDIVGYGNKVLVAEWSGGTWVQRVLFDNSDGINLESPTTDFTKDWPDGDDKKTNNDWLHINYDGSRVAVGNVSYNNHEGAIFIFDDLSSSNDWSSYEVNRIDRPADGDMDNIGTTYIDNTPWEYNHFGETFSMTPSGDELRGYLYPTNPSGPLTNDTVVWLHDHSLTPPPKMNLPLEANYHAGSGYTALYGVLGTQTEIDRDLFLSYKGIDVNFLGYSASPVEIIFETKTPTAWQDTNYFNIIQVTGDWGSGNETRDWHIDDATASQNVNFSRWVWPAVVGDAFIDGNTYTVRFL